MEVDSSQVAIMADAEERLGSHLTRIRNTERRILDRSRQILGGTSTYTSARQHESATDFRRAVEPVDVLERLIGKTDDIVSIEFLEAGLLARRAIGRIWDGAQSSSTGFHVGLGIIMTAGHSLPSIAEASDHVLQMDYEEQSLGTPRRISEFSLDPEAFFLRNDEYDVALCAATDFTGMAPPLDSFGWHVLSMEDENISTGTPISLIQHPDGRMKSLVVHNSHFVDTGKSSHDDRYCWYTADTRPGSSGAPVFDPAWRILALHHSAVPARNSDRTILDRSGRPIYIDGIPVTALKSLENLSNVSFQANEGIRASRLVRWLKTASIANPAQDLLRQKLVDLWSQPGAQRIARQAAERGAT